MKKLVLVAAAMLTLGVGSAFAQSYGYEIPHNNQHQSVQR